MQGEVGLGGLRGFVQMLGAGPQGLTLVSARVFPKLPSDLDRVDPRVLPPGSLVAGAMHAAMMCATERNCELIARLAAERAGLHKLQVMRIGRFATAQQARLLGDEPQVLLVAVALRRADREHALVDPAGLMFVRAPAPPEWLRSNRQIGCRNHIGRRVQLDRILRGVLGALC